MKKTLALAIVVFLLVPAVATFVAAVEGQGNEDAGSENAPVGGEETQGTEDPGSDGGEGAPDDAGNVEFPESPDRNQYRHRERAGEYMEASQGRADVAQMGRPDFAGQGRPDFAGVFEDVDGKMIPLAAIERGNLLESNGKGLEMGRHSARETIPDTALEHGQGLDRFRSVDYSEDLEDIEVETETLAEDYGLSFGPHDHE